MKDRIQGSASKFWTFSQSVAWVMYRRRDLVEYAATSSVGLIAMYPSHFSPEPGIIGHPPDLIEALADERIFALGIRDDRNTSREPIPAADWVGVLISGDRVTWTSNGAAIPPRWTDIILESADVQKLWRAPNEIEARSKYDWAVIRTIYDEVRTEQPMFSQNEVILEVQGIYRDRFKKEPPGRSTLQRNMRKWS